ncbi:Proteinaceous RNase P 3 [Vitis vinifera]|uniref:ribonuclease P n=1 Tax=Vitis vinifera TaxID=29760 RepID=A0A438E932_VITVI|nr:Proteinaceous RNase P 3 [Vitis vinifera]
MKKKKNNKTTVEGKFRFDLDTCSKRRDLSGAVALFESAVSQNFRLIHYHFNALLYLCTISIDEPSSKALALDYGFRIFDHMVNSGVTPNEATITAVARLAAAKSDGDLAFELVRTMGKYELSPRLRTYGPALFWFCANLEGEKAWAVEEHMVSMGVHPEEPELAALLKVSAEMGRGDKVYAYLHKLRTAVRSVSESTAEIIEGWFCGEAASEVGGVDCCLGAIEEVALKNGGGWHGQGWIGKGKWLVCRAKVDSSGQCGSCREQLATVDIDRAETETFLESVAAMAMEREVRSNFREFQDWLDKHADYEAIVDGANIGLYQQNFANEQLDAVVKELYDRSQKKRPLVILHNKRFRKLSENASNRKLLQEWLTQGVLYTTPNGSNDDWYWLYAAVKLKCLLVTNDEMRDHIFELLGSSFFLKWKERHQMSLGDFRSLSLITLAAHFSNSKAFREDDISLHLSRSHANLKGCPKAVCDFLDIHSL